jgi:hemoglobin
MSIRPDSLFARLGGDTAIMATVERFHEKVLADPVTSPFFVRLDFVALARKHTAFLSRAFDGPAELGGRDLREAHAALVDRGLGDTHFDAVLLHLATALHELGIESSLIGEVLERLSTMRPQVLLR